MNATAQSNQSPVKSEQSQHDIPLSPAAIDAVLATVEIVENNAASYPYGPWVASSPATPYPRCGDSHTDALKRYRRSLPFQWQFIDWSRIAA